MHCCFRRVRLFQWLFAAALAVPLAALNQFISAAEPRGFVGASVVPATNSQAGSRADSSNTEKAVCRIAFSPDGDQFATGLADGDIVIWDAQSGALRRSLAGHQNAVASLAFSADSKLMLSGGYDGDAFCWNVRTGEKMFAMRDHAGEVMSVAFSANGKMVATGSDWGQAILWDGTTGRKLGAIDHRTEDRLPGYVYFLSFEPNGKILATGSEDKTIILWDTRTLERRRLIGGLTGDLTFVGFSPDGKLLATSDYFDPSSWKNAKTGGSREARRTTSVWDPESGARLRTLDGATALGWAGDGRLLVDRPTKRTIASWNPVTLAEGGIVDYSSAMKNKPRQDPDPTVWSSTGNKKRLTFLGAGGTTAPVVLWDTEKAKAIRELVGY